MNDIDRAIQEIREVREAKRLQEEHERFVDNPDCTIAHFLVGNLTELPMWAQAYIKTLRENVWSLVSDAK